MTTDVTNEGNLSPPAPAGEAEQERKKLLVRAGIVSAGTLFSRILGMAREAAFAALFHAHENDAFFVAFRIPNGLRQIFAEGAISSAVVPVLSDKLAREGEDPAKSFFARIRGISLLVLTVVSILGVVFARQLCLLFAGGAQDRPEDFERTVELTRVVFPYIFFMGTAALGMAALNAKRRFAVAAFAPSLLNVAFLIAAFALPPVLVRLGWDRALAMAIGAIVGGILQVVAQWPSLRAIGFFSRPILDFRDPGVREVFRRMIPVVFGMGIYYIDLILSTWFLSGLGRGAQSYFSWAMRLCDFPQAIFVMALSTAALPSLSTLAAKGDTGELQKTYSLSMRLSLFVALPASAAMIALAHPIVAAVYQRGHFDATSANETARALVWQGVGIWTVAAVRQLVSVFYAMRDTRTPVIVSGIDLLVFIGTAFVLSKTHGHVGVSIAVTASSAAQMVMLFVALKGRLGDLRAREIGRSVLRAIVASAVAALVSRALLGPLERMLGPILVTLITLSVFGLTFALAATLVRSDEMATLTTGLRSKLQRRRSQ